MRKAAAAPFRVCRLIEAPWWAKHLGAQPGSWWLRAIQPGTLNALPLRRRVGLLNAMEDLLKHLGHRLAPLLPVLIALIITVLEAACAPIAALVRLLHPALYPGIFSQYSATWGRGVLVYPM